MIFGGKREEEERRESGRNLQGEGIKEFNICNGT